MYSAVILVAVTYTSVIYPSVMYPGVIPAGIYFAVIYPGIVYPAVMLLNGGPDVTVADSAFGMNFNQVSVWFGIIVVKMAEVCLITPPIGLNCFVVAGVRKDIPVTEVFKGVTLFFIADILTILGLVLFPQVITWLPDLMMS